MGLSGQMMNLTQLGSKPQVSSQSSASARTNESDSKDDFLSSLQKKLDSSSNSKEIKKALQEKVEDRKKEDSVKEEDIAELISLLQNLSPKLKQKLVSSSNDIDKKMLQNLQQQLQQLLSNSSEANKLDLNKLKSNLTSLLDGLKKVEQQFKLQFNETKDANKLQKMLSQLNGQVTKKPSENKQPQNIFKQQGKFNRNSTDKSNAEVVKDNSNSKSNSEVLKDNLSSTSKQQKGATDQVFEKVQPDMQGKGDIATSKLDQQDSGKINPEFATVNNIKSDQAQATQKSSSTNFNTKLNFKNILQQITDKTNVFANKVGEKINLQLQPESLGKLQIQLGVKDGAMTAKILAESSNVKELLDGNLAKLKTALEQKGLQIEQIDLAVGDEGGELAQQQFGESRQQQFQFQQEEREEFDLSLEELEESKVDTKNNQEEAINDENVDYVV
ncbi:hypothetical protein JCM16358_07720 [Halanaerocella petrolearia]